MKLVKKLLFVAGLVSFVGSSHSMAAELTAKEVVNNAFKYMGSLDKYAFDAVIRDHYIVNEDKDEHLKHTVSVKLERPGKLRVDVKGDLKDRSSYFNEGLFTMIDHDFGYYGQLKTPKTVDGALDFVIKKYGINAPLTSLLYSDMTKRAKFSASKNFGETKINGIDYDYVAFKKKNKVIHVWIAQGDKPLVKAYSIIETTPQATFRTDTSVTWNENPTFKKSDFVFTAPKGVTKISVEAAN